MLDKTITSALLQLRAQIIRGSLDGLEHVEALLRARGVDLPRVPRQQPKDRFRKSGLRLLILGGLRRGPVQSAVLIEQVMSRQPDLTRTAAMHRVHNALWKMKGSGVVARDGRLWRLAQ